MMILTLIVVRGGWQDLKIVLDFSWSMHVAQWILTLTVLQLIMIVSLLSIAVALFTAIRGIPALYS
jgi:hypothetical protein